MPGARPSTLGGQRSSSASTSGPRASGNLLARSWSERAPWALLALAAIVSSGLILWLNRGTTFFVDELIWFSDLGGDNGLRSILAPHNGHLHGTTRTVYLLTMDAVGTHYVIFRILGVFSVVLCAGLFLAFAKRRMPSAAALVPSILLLFYGSAWQHVVVPIGFTVLFSIAMGLAALLVLERGDRRGDILACLFLCISVFTFTVGLGFLVGVAVATLLRADRLRRAWVFLVPLALYTGWWLWALQFDQGRAAASSLANVPGFFAESLAVICQSLVGLKSISEGHPSAIGWVLAVLFVAALAWRFRRGDVSPMLYAAIGVLGTYWLAAALTEDTGPFAGAPGAVRYIYPGTIGVLLVATAAAQGLRISRSAMAALLAVGIFSLVGNLRHLDEGADFFRDYSLGIRANLAMLELGNGSDPGASSGQSGERRPQLADSIPYLANLGVAPDGYLVAAARYGSPAFSLGELRAQAEPIRGNADDALTQTYGLALEPSDGPSSRLGCRGRDASGGPVALPATGALLQANHEPVQLSLSRFGPPPGIDAGTVEEGTWSRLTIPADLAPEPWTATFGPTGSVTVCPIG